MGPERWKDLDGWQEAVFSQSEFSLGLMGRSWVRP